MSNFFFTTDGPIVTFIHNSTSEFNEGYTPTFTCTAQGNPPPNLTITRKRTNKRLASIERNFKKAELIHTIGPLDCLDTDVYVCTGQNNRNVTAIEMIVQVKCSLQLVPNMKHLGVVEVALGETAELSLEIYGYPIPELLTLMRTRDSTNLTGSARHLIQYSPGQAPFGFVNVTISDVVEEDFTNYTILVSNGVGGENTTLVYPFCLVEMTARRTDSGNKIIYVVSVVAVLALLAINLISVVLVLRPRCCRQPQVLEAAQVVEYLEILPDPANLYEEDNLSDSANPYEEITFLDLTSPYEEIPAQAPEGEVTDHKQAQVLQPKQTNEYEEYDPDPTCKLKGATAKLCEGKSRGPQEEPDTRTYGQRQQQANEGEECVTDPTNKYEGAAQLFEEEGMGPNMLQDPKQIQVPSPDEKNIFEESGSQGATGYETPALVFVEGSMKPPDDAQQRRYVNCSPPQQENNDNQHTFDTNINIDIGEEKCVYVSSAGQDSQQGDPKLSGSPSDQGVRGRARGRAKELKRLK
ncbi:hypothetical protein PoB_005381100 [Plakobranchus ocellatus]|uniref:Ig-like domain-containing protein n=1 Tax=Plakobranchus ocellatus TaxID=259542 RepID=A0AAV4C3H5_9GAST|nr:hypothetical protein PoB_005381100 [Plakobranchus ocellatus]